MNKYFRILLLAMLVVVMVSGTAFAGSITVKAGTPATLALEAMGSARNLTLSTGANGTNFSFISSGSLISGDLINFTFTNVGMTGNTIYLCESGSATSMDATTPTANSTNISVRANRSITAGSSMFLTNGDCTASDLALRFPAISSATMATVSFNVTSFGTQRDSANAVNVANISRQYVSNYVAGNSTIDFSTNSSSNGARFVGASNNAAVAGQAAINYTSMDMNTAAASPHAGLSVSALLSLQDSSSWQGVQRVYINANGACSLATNNAVNNSPSGTVNLALPTTAFNGTATFGANMCADVTGSVALQSRTIKGAFDISVGTGGNDPAGDSYTALMNWTPNGYQGIIPYISASSSYKTICIISNKSSASAPATLDLLSTESGATLTSLSGLSLGTIAAQGTVRVDFDSSIQPYSYSGGTETAGTATTLTGIQSNDRYTAMINVGASPTQVTVNCMQTDPAGSKRAVPVLTQTGGSTVWQQ